MKQTGGNIYIPTSDELINMDVCRGIHCDRPECQKACGFLRLHKQEKGKRDKPTESKE